MKIGKISGFIFSAFFIFFFLTIESNACEIYCCSNFAPLLFVNRSFQLEWNFYFLLFTKENRGIEVGCSNKKLFMAGRYNGIVVGLLSFCKY
jgi:hypothetical protein